MSGGTIGVGASKSASSNTTSSSTANEGTSTDGFGSGSGISGTTTATVATVAVGGEIGEPGGKKKKATKRRKVNHACLYCRRSHMTCDEGRPCQRCIKREIGHLCHDEQRPPKQDRHTPQIVHATTTLNPAAVSTSRSLTPSTVSATVSAGMTATGTGTAATNLPYLAPGQPPFFIGGYGGYGGETFGSEFSVLSDFLEALDDSTFFAAPTTTGSTLSPTLMFSTFVPSAPTTSTTGLATSGNTTTTTTTIAPAATSTAPLSNGVTTTTEAGPTPNSNTEAEIGSPSVSVSVSTPSTSNPSSDTLTNKDKSSISVDVMIKSEEDESPLTVTLPLPAPTKTEKFLLTAADQDSGLSRDERLSRVIRSKYEAGLLKPYNYVKGYARLSRWMDVNVSQESKRQILQPLSVLRPKFRAIAQSLRDIDLVFIEEAFERLLLDYDRVFSAMGVPACLWRRTGEIYKGNREFSQLVGVDGYLMREGRLCIYELMAEESAVNYWEKYGNVAFDSSQKAVLTSCVLRYKPVLSVGGGGGSSSTTTAAGPGPGGQVVGAGLGSRFGYPAPMMPPSKSISSNTASGATGTGAGDATTPGTGSGADVEDQVKEAGLINCCFSFTIRRDKWGIPSMIVGNFIRC